MSTLQKRIDYKGDLEILLNYVCNDFDIGEYSSHDIIAIGYEDFNLKLKTDKNVYFVKIFASFRDRENCKRYVDVILNALESGISHPLLYKSSKGYLYEIFLNKFFIRLCVMEYIEGKSFYELKENPISSEIKFITKQVTLINSMKIKPKFIYDSWAVTSFIEQFQKKSKYLTIDDLSLIKPSTKVFNLLKFDVLPHCFVHGDITKTNTLKDQMGRVKIIDFAVSNYYPRIVDLAALFSDLFFDQNNPEKFFETYNFVLKEYQRYVPLTENEIKSLPLVLNITHAMHVLNANYEKVILKNLSQENVYYLNTGRAGLKLTNEIWN